MRISDWSSDVCSSDLLSWSRIFGSKLDLQLWGTNLTNTEKPISNSHEWHLTYLLAYVYSEPRLFGLNLSYRWGKYRRGRCQNAASSEERRVGTDCVSTSRSRWSQYNKNIKNKIK